MKDFTVFYAWQSDSEEKVNRFFIRDALKTALERIKKDASIDDSPRIDHDTKNVAGIPEIANTLLNKIDTCSVFVADVTIVGRTTTGKDIEKLLPNPNVTLELGYALKSVGSEAIICVMNQAFGPVEAQIFDLAHRRWPITYQLDNYDHQNRKDIQKSLSADIESALRMIIAQGIPDKRDPIEIRNEMVREQFRTAIYTFLALFRFLLHYENQIQQFDERTIQVFGLDKPPINGGGVEYTKIDKKVIDQVFDDRDLTRLSKITIGRDSDSTLQFGEAILFLVKKLRNECKEIIQNYGAAGDPILIKQIEIVAGMADSLKFHDNGALLEFPDSFVRAISDLFNQIVASNQYIQT